MSRALPSFPTRRSSDLSAPIRKSKPFPALAAVGGAIGSVLRARIQHVGLARMHREHAGFDIFWKPFRERLPSRSEEHTSELQSLRHLVCRLLLENKNQQ